MANEVPKWDSIRKSVIALSKTGSVDALLLILRDLINFANAGHSDVNTVKVAVNITGNKILDTDSPNMDMVTAFRELLVQLTSQLPLLTELESVQYSLMKCDIALGSLSLALKLAVSCCEARSRMFSAILRKCGETRDYPMALETLQAMEARSLVASEDDYAYMIESMETQLNFGTFFGQVLTQLNDYMVDRPLSLESSLLIKNLLHVVGGRSDFRLSRDVEIPDGVCPQSGVHLKQNDLSDSELEELIDMTRQLDPNGVLAGLCEPYNDGSYDVIFDGANIAHVNQNFDQGYFRFDQIDEIMKVFRSQGKKCLLVLHAKWTKPRRNLALPTKANRAVKRPLPQIGESTCSLPKVEITERPVRSPLDENLSEMDKYIQNLIATWQGELLQVPHGYNDDWVWLYLCLLTEQRRRRTAGGSVWVVSNDLMRDHFWRMRTPRCFTKLKNCHLCRFAIKFDEAGINQYTCFPPTHFSAIVQKNSNVWHVPYIVEETVRWLVIEQL